MSDLDAGGEAAAAVLAPSMGSVELAEAGRVVGELAGVVDAAGGGSSRPDLAEVIAGCQGLINALTAVQDVAIMHVAAIEEEWGEDGLIVESRRAPGHVALDAPDVVAGALCVSHGQAQRRVSLAARLAAAGQDADDEDAQVAADSPDAVDGEDAGPVGSGLGGVHAAMRDGRLDGYAASVLGEELELAPADVGRAVVAALENFFGREAASVLRRRCRRVLAGISPDLLRQRAQKARSESGLRRWAEEPGVDRWAGTFPSEQAALGWAAVDALARRYVAEGVCDRLEQARGKALIDLVTGNANIDVTVVFTTSQDTDPDGPDASRPTGTGPEADPDVPDRPGPDLEPDVSDEREDRGADPFPAPFPDPAGSPAAAQPRSPATVDADLVEAYGPFAGDPMLVRRSWLVGLLKAGAKVAFAPCHRRTGALLGEEDTGTRAYRPGEKVKALVRARDGRCRFPGCQVAARFCDLDHVVAWPTGPSTAGNLMCLCRRHHRIKQRPGWSVRLAVDGTATWTDPLGRERVTWPRNHLDLLTLSGPTPGTTTADPAPAAAACRETAAGPSASTEAAHQGQARTFAPARPENAAEDASTLETILEVLGDGYQPSTHPHRPRAQRPWRGDLIPPRTGRARLRHQRTFEHPHYRTGDAGRLASSAIEIEPPPF